MESTDGTEQGDVLISYADSSFIALLYLQQQNSGKALAYMEKYNQSLPFTPWHRLEVRNAIRLAAFNGLIDEEEARVQLRQIEQDLREETLLSHTAIPWTDVLRLAEELGATHNRKVGCRSSDIFHVASALALGSRQFVTLDQKQAKLAKLAGMAVSP